MSKSPAPYNPLDRVELGKSVERALLKQPLDKLPPPRVRTASFSGAGIYAVYYTGHLSLYEPISLAHSEHEIPIYVGRARPKGARQGSIGGLDASTPERVLYERLREHHTSLLRAEEHAESHAVEGIHVDDFVCRYLVADDIWVPLGEALLIGHYRPVWNVVVDGFGNHDPGGGRSKQARSAWDDLHPGRKWAFKLQPATRPQSEVVARIYEHLAHAQTPDFETTPVLDVELQIALAAETNEKE